MSNEFLDIILKAWQFPITEIEGNSITPGKIIIGLTLFIGGMIVSKVISRKLKKILPMQVQSNPGALSALESLCYYTLLLISFLFALSLANVPLTALTFLGGALAIGVGFGSQNIVNNFISGLILLIERPIKVGDFIEVEGTYGTVEHVGARSTRIRSVDYRHIIVPNSVFLEKNVVNWTLSDDINRASIKVGVAYGSPTKKVAELILQAVKEHPKLLNYKDPVVLFTEFGDSALQFECLFWLRIKALLDKRIIQSEIHHRIDEIFKEAGIVIAFPQRDVHLDAPHAIRVQLEKS